MKLFKKRPERPYLKICEKCHGKGQLSYHNNNQQKTYGACDECSKQQEDSSYSLGVKLKCACQDRSSTYEWVLSTQLKRLPGDEPDLVALKDFQREVGEAGTALLITCDNCGARHLCVDGPQRKKISGAEGQNVSDKTYNKEVAGALIKNGITRTIPAQRAP
mmetsp:Transcript_38027/g.84683  ORF Transcript_38027/g.84683 Transcript_38027/m.84683 type:complete len:162 (+) Transcript_38027:181-666(+)|eukprot:CAMPEP_0202896072 /NCGR_PEP_ID=MMETSP1392-20130828/5145_1 /ASSEMBLY_ACC=CAM_ASM_000868 /TAXON_ID=225041 /ORGANISM="Chlamydomonas chlamydogama, Strain SAG 11-48b" /LENGTH=161 /DNA_ID=CAMNT_0049581301 /DNA_START=165 /DNA_END=650 /DNA_ORIENTATION=-